MISNSNFDNSFLKVIDVEAGRTAENEVINDVEAVDNTNTSENDGESHGDVYMEVKINFIPCIYFFKPKI